MYYRPAIMYVSCVHIYANATLGRNYESALKNKHQDANSVCIIFVNYTIVRMLIPKAVKKVE